MGGGLLQSAGLDMYAKHHVHMSEICMDKKCRDNEGSYKHGGRKQQVRR